MDRRKFLYLSAGSAASLSSCARLIGAKDTIERTILGPNILMVLVDQMRRPVWFSEDMPLPNYERLKSGGAELTNHFTSAAACSPSRACIMTGLHMDQHRVYLNVGEGKDQPGLSRDFVTLGELFRSAGYKTPYFGKWHLSWHSEYTKDRLNPHGFQWEPPDRVGATGRGGLMYDEGFTDKACAWLKSWKSRTAPWFLTLSLINPHDIHEYPDLEVPDNVPRLTKDLPPNFFDSLDNKPRCQQLWRRRNAWWLYDEGCLRLIDYYYYLNLRADELLGRVLNALEDTGQADDTIVVFTSDHGDMAGSHGLKGKGPCIYSEQNRVPLLVSWPGRIPAGLSVDKPAQNVDILPTLAGLSGVGTSSIPYPLSGMDLSPLLAENSTTEDLLKNPDERILLFSNERGFNEAPHRIRSIKHKDWAYAHYFNHDEAEHEYELYNEKQDPLQMKNLAKDQDHGQKMEEMNEMLRQTLAELSSWYS